MGTMDNKTMRTIAMQQSAQELNCTVEDFLKKKNVVVPFRETPLARAYYKLPQPCNLVSYGNNVVASVQEELRGVVREYLDRYEWFHCFETPNMNWLAEKLAPYGQQICFMAEYWLPDLRCLPEPDCTYELRTLHHEDFKELYLPQWSNALCKERAELDVLGVGAYKGDDLVGLAACSSDCETMWQIGVDVLRDFRNQGIARAVVSRLTREIVAREKVPFYCCAWSNVPSARTAIHCGYRPAWVEMTVKPTEIVSKMNDSASSLA